MKIERLAVDPP